MSKTDKKLRRVGENLYQRNGVFIWRCRNAEGKRTWRTLEAGTLKFAVLELDKLQGEVSASERGSGRHPLSNVLTVGELISEYLAADCPTFKLKPRPWLKVRHTYLLNRPSQFFGAMDAKLLRLKHLVKYRDWALTRMRKGTKGLRTVDQELVALSVAYRWGMTMDLVDLNPIAMKPQFQPEDEVRNCREVAPESGDELHRIVAEFFEDPRSEVLGWQCLFESMIGCRTNEILRLKVTAKSQKDPGFVNGGYLFLKRSKKGVNPYALIHPDLAEAIRAHANWRAIRYPESEWWLPGRTGINHVDKGALTHGLARICPLLELPHRTSHGMRSYYVTVRRGAGIPDWQIAREIGVSTVDVVRRTYGDTPDNFQSGNLHSWRPSKGDPAWAIWLPENCSVIPMKQPELSNAAAQ